MTNRQGPARQRHKDAIVFFKARQNFRPVDDLGEMRRADFFFAFSYQNKLTGSLRPAPRMACSAARNVACGPF